MRRGGQARASLACTPRQNRLGFWTRARAVRHSRSPNSRLGPRDLDSDGSTCCCWGCLSPRFSDREPLDFPTRVGGAKYGAGSSYRRRWPLQPSDISPLPETYGPQNSSRQSTLALTLCPVASASPGPLTPGGLLIALWEPLLGAGRGCGRPVTDWSRAYARQVDDASACLLFHPLPSPLLPDCSSWLSCSKRGPGSRTSGRKSRSEPRGRRYVGQRPRGQLAPAGSSRAGSVSGR